MCDSSFFDLLRKEAARKPDYAGVPLFGTIPVRVSTTLPPDTAAFVDKDGKILAVFKFDT